MKLLNTLTTQNSVHKKNKKTKKIIIVKPMDSSLYLKSKKKKKQIVDFVERSSQRHILKTSVTVEGYH